jgi:hypothetical protein
MLPVNWANGLVQLQKSGNSEDAAISASVWPFTRVMSA